MDNIRNNNQNTDNQNFENQNNNKNSEEILDNFIRRKVYPGIYTR